MLPLAVAPFVHVESEDVVAGDVPLLEEVDRPAVHPHRPDRQDHRRLLAGLARLLDRQGDFVAHHDVEIGDRLAGNRLESRVPPGLAIADRLGRVRTAAVDPGEVPAARQKPLHHRAGVGGEQIHCRRALSVGGRHTECACYIRL